MSGTKLRGSYNYVCATMYIGYKLNCLLQLLVSATMAVYKDAVTNFLPTPSKSHYVFNLRDFARVIRGVLLVPHEKMSEIDKLHRLWVHEVYRVFYDRLIDKQDR